MLANCQGVGSEQQIIVAYENKKLLKVSTMMQSYIFYANYFLLFKMYDPFALADSEELLIFLTEH
jgi:hypothetical protein